jgi:SRSO17 transposase
MPAKIILNQENEVNNYILHDLKLPISNPQRKHLELLVSGIIGCSDKRTISNIVRSSVSQTDRSCTQRFLNSSPWDENLVNLRRKQYTEKALKKELEASGEPLFVILDDTINKKNKDSKHIDGLGFNYSHTSGKQEWSHNIQGLHCIADKLSVPFDFELYLKKDYCVKRGREFKSKVDFSINLLKQLDLQQKHPAYFLTDSWYTSPKLINEATRLGYQTIGALKSNRIFYPAGIRQKLSEFVQYITDSDLDLVTVKEKKYKVYRYEGKMNNLENAVILFTWDANSPSADPKYLLCSDVSLDSKTIMEYYSKRWQIETSFRYLKDRFGFDHYQMRSLKAIKRFWLVQYIAYGYIEFYRYRHCSIFKLENLGDTIDHLKAFNMRNLVDYVYNCGKNNVDIASVHRGLALVV